MSRHRPARQRLPIALGGPKGRPRPVRPADLLVDPATVEAPMPGRLLVLLSRLHRAEQRVEGRTGTAPDETGEA